MELFQNGLGSELAEGLLEWSWSGGVERTWRAKLGKRPLSAKVAKCFEKYNKSSPRNPETSPRNQKMSKKNEKDVVEKSKLVLTFFV